MKMISTTRMMSTNGVMLMSVIASSSPPPSREATSDSADAVRATRFDRRAALVGRERLHASEHEVRDALDVGEQILVAALEGVVEHDRGNRDHEAHGRGHERFRD